MYWHTENYTHILCTCLICTFRERFCYLMNLRKQWKGSVFIPIPKKGNAKECSNYHTTVLISHTSKVKLKILQARLQQSVNPELPDVQAGFRKSTGTRDQTANTHWTIEKAKKFQKNIYYCFVDYTKAFDCVGHNKLENSLRDGNTRPPYLPPRNLYAGQEATVRTGHGTTDWFQTGQGVHQHCLLSSCLFNMLSTSWETLGWMKRKLESRLPGERNNLRYADDTTLMAEREEELKSLLMKVKGEWKRWLKAQHSEN